MVLKRLFFYWNLKKFGDGNMRLPSGKLAKGWPITKNPIKLLVHCGRNKSVVIEYKCDKYHSSNNFYPSVEKAYRVKYERELDVTKITNVYEIVEIEKFNDIWG